MEIFPAEGTPKITEEDIKILLDNFEDINIWKEKFPPKSYIFKGFGIMNLFDVTTDEIISEIRTSLIKKDDNLVHTLEGIFQRFFGIPDLSLGFSIFETDSNNFSSSHINKEESLVLNYDKDVSCDCIFCNYTLEKLFINNETLAISDVEKYGNQAENKNLYQRLKDKNIGSIILVPIQASTKNSIAIIEFASPRPFELNSINQNKLQDLIPLFKIAVDRFSEEHKNILEATIQENYTSIHPTVKWRFYEAAERFHRESYEAKEKVKIEDIIFPDVHPLYGQSDIKGSSVARNAAIKEDLITQLSLAIPVSVSYTHLTLPTNREV
eukprot:TRINITY_DN4982_c0_g3_i7.p1 TRINITY_DN4982_c0_g3~~TRINITY_DN4982_c0_g3_i7.p1  ORF type:complete len:379 (+),score=62.16 TRINITY_DN4982_c0_g3_i7:163-1137(+)